MTDQEPPAKQPPRLRLWLVSVLLFACGFVGKLVLQTQPGAADGYIVTMVWQIGWYAAGLVAWVWWSYVQGSVDKLGCGVGFGLAVAAAVDVLSSSPK